MSAPRFAIVGHPNKGKSSIVATLAEDESVAIASDPGTTTHARVYPMRRDGQTLYELIDTPGFQRAREVLGWLREHDRGAGARGEVVAEFVTLHASDARFRDECALLQPIIDGAGILYVVDGSRPYGAEYEAEMEVLRWTGQPRMALINLIGAGDHVERWRTALGQFFSIVRIFDAMRASFEQRIELLRSFGAIDETGATQLNRAADVLTAERSARRRRTAETIADLLCVALTAVATLPLAGDTSNPAIEEKARERLRESVRSEDQRARHAVQEIYHHEATRAEEPAMDLLLADVFSARSFSVFGLSATQLALTGAASGAVAGGVVDAMLGGASLLLGAGIGALIGGVSTLAGADRLAKVEVLGQPLGGFELTVGPITDPNFSWVLLGRALLHARLIAERNHARREAVAIDAARGEHLADEIDAATRRRLDGQLRGMRRERTVTAAQRKLLTQEIEHLLESSTG